MSGILKKGEQTYRLPQVYPRMVIPETEMPAKVVRWEKLEITLGKWLELSCEMFPVINSINKFK